nr:membrane protein [Mycobacterium avium subsp. paratuberculosis]
MAALSAVVFTLSAWLGLYLAARDPRKPVLVLAAIGLCGFALVVGLDAVRTASPAHAPLLSRVEIYLTAVPGVAWFAVLVELSRPPDGWRSRTREVLLVAGVAALTLLGLAGSVDGPLRPGHWLMMAAISVSTLGAMAVALRRPRRPRPAVGLAVTATLFFALANAILIIPLGLVPSWLALASTSCDVLGLGVAVALWDAFDEGHALRADMLRSFAGSVAVAVLFGGQALIGLAVTRADPGARTALTVLLFTSLAIAITVQVLADPLAGLLDRLAFSKSPALRADRAALRHTGAALPLRQEHPLDGVDDVTFARLTRRALGHYGDLTKLVASPLTALPVIDERLAARGAPDQPIERATELKAVLADAIARLKPRDGGDFGTTEEWRHYNSLYFPYVVGVRAYAQNATASGLDPTARQAWQWFVTEVPQRSLHNWQNAAARLIAADLRGRVPVPSE